MNYLLLLINILFLACGQVFFKLGLEQMGGVNISNAWKALFVPQVIIGLVMYVIATLLWFIILSRMPLSLAYPIQSFAYVLGILAALFIFNEEVSLAKWMGMGIIMIGVVFIAAD
ncbi:EamA family transporter [Paenibacillus nasutitermitis]|uniref:4-amino-4-deoxy-L-arabinose-phosphoundecaprenol flippase subunit ArnE n=1 Tax=Paenibacillus nasutitermitis TaxID=1652958 RepID=A0A916ZCY6_9BACL|nr:EamA family transporter [Paenibacillus nasutitermitis]GGD87519.1 putative 4-amino-4-deoxy-L-arabinose-phosphoundecaprenol flippase subunit ArnE [Paenibacillus nasutitermitis]